MTESEPAAIHVRTDLAAPNFWLAGTCLLGIVMFFGGATMLNSSSAVVQSAIGIAFIFVGLLLAVLPLVLRAVRHV